jgi:Flp pilus assembly protein TadB
VKQVLSLVSALSLALAVYLWYNFKHPNHTEPADEAIKKIRSRERKAIRGNSVTLQSLKILGVPYTRYKILSFIWGFLIAIAWLYIAQNYLAAAIMFSVGFQLPGLWYERRASGKLDGLGRQVAIFVGTTSDGLANGRTINEALWQAALLMREEPMYSIAQNYLKKIGGNVSITEAVTDMSIEVNMPSFRFFADLVATVKEVGTDGAKSFEVLDYKFHEEEDIQGEMRGEVSVWMGILVIFLGLTLLGPPFYRLVLPNVWLLIPRKMGWLLIASSAGTWVIFSSLRRYSRYRVTL